MPVEHRWKFEFDYFTSAGITLPLLPFMFINATRAQSHTDHGARVGLANSAKRLRRDCRESLWEGGRLDADVLSQA